MGKLWKGKKCLSNNYQNSLSLKKYKKILLFLQILNRYYNISNLLKNCNLHTTSVLPHMIKILNCHTFLGISKEF